MKKTLQLIWKMSRYLFFGVLLQTLFLSVIIASESDAQANLEGNQVSMDLKQVKIYLHVNDATLKNLFREVEAKTDFKFFYDKEILATKTKFRFNEEISLYKLLLQLSKESKLHFKQVNKNINVKAIEENTNTSSSAYQDATVTGKVTSSEDGEALPGVNVLEKGTSNGTVTDADGRYSIRVSEGATLIFSYIGFVSEEISVSAKSVIDVTMALDIASLEEIVVIGYGTVNRRDVTGAVSSIKPKDFNAGINTAPEQLMQGKIAGVDIVESSGRPGATSTVRIRGTSSISAGNDPLYVIDGIPMQFNSANIYVNVTGESTTSPLSSEGSNPLNVINPSDIESIDVLKDASATAIYGSRGANGVILITTKNRKEEGETVSYDTYFGVSSIRKTLPFMSAGEYRDYAESNGLSYPDEGANTNWQDEIFRNAMSQNHNLAFGGNSENSAYRASLGYTSQEGIILSSQLEKYTGRLNANHKALNGKLDIALHLTYAKINNDDTPVSSNIRNEGGNILKDALRWAPTLPVRNDDGSFYQIGELRINPVSWADVIDESATDNFIGSVSFTYNIFDPLSISVNLGHTNEAIERFTFVPATHPLGASEGGRASISKLKNNSSTIETTLNYSQEIGNNNSLDVMFGYSFYRYVTQNTFNLANEFVSDATRWNLMQSGNPLSNTSFKDANRLASVFGRLNYNLNNRYLLTLTIRNDGSSRFGENNRWGLFPSGALAWIVSNESFFNIESISALKLRLGYGVTGNQEIPNNLYREQLTVNGSSIYALGGQAIPSVLPSNYANPDLQWEQTSQLNIGLDWGLFGDRLTGSIDVYKKRTSDLLLAFSTVAPSVVETQWANVGEVENKGFEFTLDGMIVNNSNFQWNANLNFSRNVNEVISLSNEQFSRDEILRGPSSGVIAEGQNTQIIRPGLPIGTFYGRKFTGLDENGMDTFLDEDDDGEADRVAIGDANPDFTFGFSNSVRWNQFDASLTFRGSVGNDVFNNTAAEFSYTNSTPGVNVLRDAIDRGVNRDQTAQFSSQWIQDASFMRLDNLTIGYTLQTQNIPFLSRARVYVTGQNLFVITGYSGFDPEVRTNTDTGNPAPIGVDYMAYPRPRVFMIGASLGF